jgi:hypothetical protein
MANAADQPRVIPMVRNAASAAMINATILEKTK